MRNIIVNCAKGQMFLEELLLGNVGKKKRVKYVAAPSSKFHMVGGVQEDFQAEKLRLDMVSQYAEVVNVTTSIIETIKNFFQ